MKIHSRPEDMGGVWANAAAVRHSPHEFTIDFLRCDFDDAGKAKAGILVQRVNMSPLFVTQLIGALQDNWSKYADKSMPKDLLDDVRIESPELDTDHDDMSDQASHVDDPADHHDASGGGDDPDRDADGPDGT